MRLIFWILVNFINGRKRNEERFILILNNDNILNYSLLRYVCKQAPIDPFVLKKNHLPTYVCYWVYNVYSVHK